MSYLYFQIMYSWWRSSHKIDENIEILYFTIWHSVSYLTFVGSILYQYRKLRVKLMTILSHKTIEWTTTSLIHFQYQHQYKPILPKIKTECHFYDHQKMKQHLIQINITLTITTKWTKKVNHVLVRSPWFRVKSYRRKTAKLLIAFMGLFP